MEKTLIAYRKSHFTETKHHTTPYGNFCECDICHDHAHFVVDGVMQRHAHTPDSFEFVNAETGEILPKETVEALRTPPEFCLVPLDVERQVGMVMFNDGAGYRKTTYDQFDTIEQMREFVDATNKRMGIPTVTWETFHTCSMFDCWENYNSIWLGTLKAFPL